MGLAGFKIVWVGEFVFVTFLACAIFHEFLTILAAVGLFALLLVAGFVNDFVGWAFLTDARDE